MGFLCKLLCSSFQKPQSMQDLCHGVPLLSAHQIQKSESASLRASSEATPYPSSLGCVQGTSSSSHLEDFGGSLYAVQALCPKANGPVGQEKKGKCSGSLSWRTEVFQLFF